MSVPAGRFTFWCEEGEPGCNGKVGQDIAVNAFDIMATETTVEQYRTCVVAGACDRPGFGKSSGCFWPDEGKLSYPINCVGHNEAASFCTWVGGRLPTEEEWEYAAQGARSAFYPWGNEPPSEIHAATEKNAFRPVGSFPAGANPLGLLDMAGNVAEWTATYDESELKLGGRVVAISTGYVIKGGYAGAISQYATHDYVKMTPELRLDWLGFRCARGGKVSADEGD